ncbi:hypothetical protein VP01_771g1 [Puccinia sorghi]|uniref:Uncharacterized protein n=1 Tax=Puccinia sorghi TaxID=27349 RepID=A0A0L6UDL9_9BASI|nr:hypothetical protein VP01_771g1 [Puccinia sorghi]
MEMHVKIKIPKSGILNNEMGERKNGDKHLEFSFINLVYYKKKLWGVLYVSHRDFNYLTLLLLVLLIFVWFCLSHSGLSRFFAFLHFHFISLYQLFLLLFLVRLIIIEVAKALFGSQGTSYLDLKILQIVMIINMCLFLPVYVLHYCILFELSYHRQHCGTYCSHFLGILKISPQLESSGFTGRFTFESIVLSLLGGMKITLYIIQVIYSVVLWFWCIIKDFFVFEELVWLWFFFSGGVSVMSSAMLIVLSLIHIREASYGELSESNLRLYFWWYVITACFRALSRRLLFSRTYFNGIKSLSHVRKVAFLPSSATRLFFCSSFIGDLRDSRALMLRVPPSGSASQQQIFYTAVIIRFQMGTLKPEEERIYLTCYRACRVECKFQTRPYTA